MSSAPLAGLRLLLTRPADHSDAWARGDQREAGLSGARGGGLGPLAPGPGVLSPRAGGGGEELRKALPARGCIVAVVPASQTAPRRDLPPPPPFDVATFASPSALR